MIKILIIVSLIVFYLGVKWGIYLERYICEMARKMKERHG